MNRRTVSEGAIERCAPAVQAPRTRLCGRLLLAATAAGLVVFPSQEACAEPRGSVTIDPLAPLVGGLLNRAYGTFLESQLAPSGKYYSLILETGYLASSDYRAIAGKSSGLSMKLAIVAIGGAYWFSKTPFQGPFVSVRVEGWLASAEDREHTTVSGNQLDVNLQPGWQWIWGSFTMIAGATLGYATGPVRSADRTVEFPIHGLTFAPHLRVGYSW